MPASARARRCLVMAWRVTSVPSLKRTIESGPSLHKRETSLRRVSSPSAANSGAASLSFSAELPLADMAADILELRRPAGVVVAEGLGAAFGRQAREARFDDGEQRTSPARRFFQAELDQRHRFCGVVLVRVDGVGAPAIRKVALGYELDDLHFDSQVIVARMGNL